MWPDKEQVGSSEDSPWSRADKLALGGLLFGLAATLPWLVHPWYDAVSDASMYIETARSLVAGGGYSLLGEPFTNRPPGFSVLIAPVIAFRGVDFYALNLFVSCIGVIGIALLYCFTRPRTGWLLALLICVVVWFTPPFRFLCNKVMSDIPAISAILACLLVERWSSRKPSTARELLLGVAIGLSAYIRTVAILLLPAIVCARLVKRWVSGRQESNPKLRRDSGLFFFRRQLLPFAMAAVVVVLPWELRNASVAKGPVTDQQLNHSYATALWHQDAGDPNSPTITLEQFRERVFNQSAAIVALLGSRVQALQITPLRVAGAIAAIVLLMFAVVGRRGPAEFFVVGVLALLVVYFSIPPRFLLPATVLMLPQCSEALRRLLTYPLGHKGATAVVAALLVIMCWADFNPHLGWGGIQKKHEAWVKVANQIRDELPPATRLASAKGFHYSVYLGRPVFSLRWSARHGAGIRGIAAVIERYGVDVVLLDPRLPVDQRMLHRMEPSYGSGSALGRLRMIRVAGAGGH